MRKSPVMWEKEMKACLYIFPCPDKEVPGANMFSPRSKTWTFPNLKTPAGPAEVYLAVEEEEEEAVSFGSPFRGVGTIFQFRC